MHKKAIRGKAAQCRIAVAGILLASLTAIFTGCGGTPRSNRPPGTGRRGSSFLIISPANPVVPVGDSERFAVTEVSANGSKHDVTSRVSWSSTDPEIASVDRSGMAVAKRSGTSIIVASADSLTAGVTITVPPSVLVSIVVTPANPSLPKGGTVQLTAMATFADGSVKDVSATAAWAATDATNATVSPSGLVTGIGAGSSRITATSGVIRGASTVVVVQSTLVSMTLVPASLTLAKGKTQQLTVTGNFSDGTTQDVTAKIAWTMAPENIAGVSSTGLVTGLDSGKAAVTAISGSISATGSITVSVPSLTSLAISPSNPSLTKGASQQLAVTGTFSDGSTQNVTGSMAWTVSSAAVVTVSNSGLVTAVGNGSAMVTASSGPMSATSTISVSSAGLTSIAISPATPSIAKGQTQQFSALGTYGDGSVKDITSKVLWSSTSSSVVDINASGLLTAKDLGTATVLATSGSVNGTDEVTISGAIPVSIAIIPNDVAIALGTTRQLKAVAMLSDGTTQPLSSKVTWTSENSTIASVGLAGLITARSTGTATIDAASDTLTGSAKILVEPLKFVEYFDHADATGADEIVRMSNSGIAGENLCAMVYVFAPDQQMTECCGCHISRNGLREFSLKTDLTSNPLTGKIPVNGSIQVVPADAASNPKCDPTSITPSGTVSVWATHLESLPSGAIAVTSGHSQLAPLGNSSLSSLETQCQFINVLGSGQGTCTCGTGD